MSIAKDMMQDKVIWQFKFQLLITSPQYYCVIIFFDALGSAYQ